MKNTLLREISEKLDKIIELLQSQNDEDQGADTFTVPDIFGPDDVFFPGDYNPPPYVPPLTPIYPNTVQRKCSRCGISLDTVMSYSCSDVRCPTGLGPITS